MLLTRTAKQPERPYNVLSLDSEDSDGITYIWSVRGWFNGKDIKRDFRAGERAACVRFLFRRRWPHTVLTGVNLAYDLNTLLYRGGYSWLGIYNMGRLITASPTKAQTEKYKLGGRHLKIIELGNWILNTSLKDMCDKFGIDGHVDKHVLGRDGDIKEMEAACASHALCGAKCFDYIQSQLHAAGGRIKLTSSASSLDLFMKDYLKPEHQIYDFKNDFPDRLVGWGGIKPDDDPDTATLKIAGQDKLSHLKMIGGLCYVGGRCEAFNMGVFGRQSSIDRNSSYPAAMRDKLYPDMNTYRRVYPQVEELPDLMEKLEGCAHIKITSPGLRIPFLHYRTGDKLIFPNGVLSGWYTFPEIRKALQIGYTISECYEAAIFKPIEGLFKDYIEATYRLKERKATTKMAKLLMNGLSGKFGQKTPNDSGFQIVEDPPDNIIIDNEVYFLANGVVYEYIKAALNQEIEYVHTAYPLLSAYVLGYARIALYETMEAVGLEHVKYCDTDSVHADCNAISNAISRGEINVHPTALGAWSFDYEDSTLEIRGLKYYRVKRHEKGESNTPVKWYYTIKGVRSSEQPNYWRYRALRTNRVRKIRTALRTGLKVNEFFDIYRHDVLENPKRVFEGRDSHAFEII